MRRLLDDGVRVLLRHEDNNEGTDGLDVERAFGDIQDLDATRQSVAGCQGVYCCAASRRERLECNVLGTRNVLQAAGEAAGSW